VTANAILATAASLDGLSVMTLDQTGLAQKGGSVISSVILSERPLDTSARVGYGHADLLLGFEARAAAAPDSLKSCDPDRTRVVVNTSDVPAGASRHGRVPSDLTTVVDRIRYSAHAPQCVFEDASRAAEDRFGSHLQTNALLLGIAWQAGFIPISLPSMEQAIRLNELEVDTNLSAFHAGRQLHESRDAPPRVDRDELTGHERRRRELEAYQSAAYAGAFDQLVESVRLRAPRLAETVSRCLFRLMAYKDEYEVARLLTRPEFEARIRAMWPATKAIRYNLNPPLLERLWGQRKIAFGSWLRGPLRLLARLKGLRGTPWDPFGYTAFRREERESIAWYRRLVDDVIEHIDGGDLEVAEAILSLPDEIRGYGRLRHRNTVRVREAAREQLELFAGAAKAGRRRALRLTVVAHGEPVKTLG
jgi:indolepyruvate ferredoxin oxidoreductase